MCEKCEELRGKFQATTSITDREVFWKEFDKQRTACEKKEKKESK